MTYTRKAPDYDAPEYLQWAKSKYSDSAVKQARDNPQMKSDYYEFYTGESPETTGFKSWVSSNYPQYFKNNNINVAGEPGILGQLQRQYLFGDENPERLPGSRVDLRWGRGIGATYDNIGYEPNKLQEAEMKLARYKELMGMSIDPAQLAELEAEVEAARLEQEQRVSEAAQGFLSQKLLAEQGRKMGRAERAAGQGTSRQRSATRLAT